MACQQTLKPWDSHAMLVQHKHPTSISRAKGGFIAAQPRPESSSNQTHFVLKSRTRKESRRPRLAKASLRSLLDLACSCLCLKSKLTGPLVKLSLHLLVGGLCHHDALSAPPSLRSISEDPSSYCTPLQTNKRNCDRQR